MTNDRLCADRLSPLLLTRLSPSLTAPIHFAQRVVMSEAAPASAVCASMEDASATAAASAASSSSSAPSLRFEGMCALNFQREWISAPLSIALFRAMVRLETYNRQSPYDYPVVMEEEWQSPSLLSAGLSYLALCMFYHGDGMIRLRSYWIEEIRLQIAERIYSLIIERNLFDENSIDDHQQTINQLWNELSSKLRNAVDKTNPRPDVPCAEADPPLPSSAEVFASHWLTGQWENRRSGPDRGEFHRMRREMMQLKPQHKKSLETDMIISLADLQRISGISESRTSSDTSSSSSSSSSSECMKSTAAAVSTDQVHASVSSSSSSFASTSANTLSFEGMCAFNFQREWISDAESESLWQVMLELECPTHAQAHSTRVTEVLGADALSVFTSAERLYSTGMIALRKYWAEQFLTRLPSMIHSAMIKRGSFEEDADAEETITQLWTETVIKFHTAVAETNPHADSHSVDQVTEIDIPSLEKVITKCFFAGRWDRDLDDHSSGGTIAPWPSLRKLHCGLPVSDLLPHLCLQTTEDVRSSVLSALDSAEMIPDLAALCAEYVTCGAAADAFCDVRFLSPQLTDLSLLIRELGWGGNNRYHFVQVITAVIRSMHELPHLTALKLDIMPSCGYNEGPGDFLPGLQWSLIGSLSSLRSLTLHSTCRDPDYGVWPIWNESEAIDSLRQLTHLTALDVTGFFRSEQASQERMQRFRQPKQPPAEDNAQADDVDDDGERYDRPLYYYCSYAFDIELFARLPVVHESLTDLRVSPYRFEWRPEDCVAFRRLPNLQLINEKPIDEVLGAAPVAEVIEG